MLCGNLEQRLLFGSRNANEQELIGGKGNGRRGFSIASSILKPLLEVATKIELGYMWMLIGSKK